MSQVRTDRLDASWVETLDRVQAFVAARVGDPDLAADITQDVVVRSIASGALDRVDNPAAWLYRSARNAVIDHYRTRHVHDPFDGDDAWPDPGPLDNEPNDATRELARCLQPMLHALPPTARDALTPGRCRWPDPPAGGGSARLVGVGDEVPGAAGPPPAQGLAAAVLHRRSGRDRCRGQLPPDRAGRVRLRRDAVLLLSGRGTAAPSPSGAGCRRSAPQDTGMGSGFARGRVSTLATNGHPRRDAVPPARGVCRRKRSSDVRVRIVRRSRGGGCRRGPPRAAPWPCGDGDPQRGGGREGGDGVAEAGGAEHVAA